MPIIGLSCRPVVPLGTAVFWLCSVVPLGPAARLTTMWGCGSARTPYQRLPRSSAARVGSQHRSPLNVPPPGSFVVEGITTRVIVPGFIESFEIQASGLPLAGFAAAITRALLFG